MKKIVLTRKESQYKALKETIKHGCKFIVLTSTQKSLLVLGPLIVLKVLLALIYLVLSHGPRLLRLLVLVLNDFCVFLNRLSLIHHSLLIGLRLCNHHFLF